MRTVLFIVIVAVVVIIGAVVTGFINVREIRGASAPSITATRSAISAKGGQSPAFDVETGSVKVGTKESNVAIPTLQIQKPGQAQAKAQANNAV